MMPDIGDGVIAVCGRGGMYPRVLKEIEKKNDP